MTKMRLKKRIVYIGVSVVLLSLSQFWWSFTRFPYSKKPENPEDLQHVYREPLSEKWDVRNYTSFQKKQLKLTFVRTDIDNQQDTNDMTEVTPQLQKDVKVIIVPYSGQGVSFDVTPEEHYNSTVRNILNLAVDNLQKHTNMTFIWPEVMFLNKWWSEQDVHSRSVFRNLTRSGRLEIVSGGWTVQDETVTHFSSLVSQMIDGHMWLKKNLDYSPVTVWSVSQHGHSATPPYLWSKAGVKNMIIANVGKRYRQFLSMKKSLEFKWRQIWDQAKRDDVMCHLSTEHLLNLFKSNADLLSDNATQVEFGSFDNSSTARNDINQTTYSSDLFIERIRQESSKHKHNVVLIPLAGDFSSEKEWSEKHTEIMRLIQDIQKSQPSISIRYGTPHSYFEEVRRNTKTSKTTFPVYGGDFLSYSDDSGQYWTGVYSAYPAQKRAIRILSDHLFTARIFEYLANAATLHEDTSLDIASDTLNLVQTHGLMIDIDNPNMVQYSRDITERAIGRTQYSLMNSIRKTLANYVKRHIGTNKNVANMFKSLKFVRSQLNILAGDFRSIIIMNSLGYKRNEIITIDVDTYNIQIKTAEGGNVRHQISPIRDRLKIISETAFELQFEVNVPAMGFVKYSVESLEGGDNSSKIVPNAKKVDVTLIDGNLLLVPEYVYDLNLDTIPRKLENEFILIDFDPKGGNLLRLFFKPTKLKISIITDVMAYTSSKHSGARVFQPTGEEPDYLTRKPNVFMAHGELSERLEVSYPAVRLVFTLFKGRRHQSRYLDIQCHVNIEKLRNKELILRFVTDINNKGIFYTDDNSYQFVRRETIPSVNVSGNYYPISSAVAIEDEGRRLILHSAQPHGVSSLHNGWLEVMLDRFPQMESDQVTYTESYTARLLLDLEHCHKKPGMSPLLLVPSFMETAAMEHVLHPLHVLASPERIPGINGQVLNRSLPPGTTIVFLKHAVNKDEFVLNIVFHQRAQVCCGCTTSFSKGVQLNLWTLLRDMAVTFIKEMTLTFIHRKRTVHAGETVELKPMSLTAFEITYELAEP